MNFSQLHERLRNEISRRIERGVLNGAGLAARTGLRQSHISNFVRRKRRFSLDALDRVLDALSLTVYDLLPPRFLGRTEDDPESAREIPEQIPLVSAVTAIRSPLITPAATLEFIRVSGLSLKNLRLKTPGPRNSWQRFVAVRLKAEDALPMAPLLQPESIVILDRHATSIDPRPEQQNIYAVNAGTGTLLFRYVTRDAQRLILRPHTLAHPIELIDVGDDPLPPNLVVGRICLSISPR
jgi:transcriptional regulator with XRE-family HTH domain